MESESRCTTPLGNVKMKVGTSGLGKVIYGIIYQNNNLLIELSIKG